MKANRKVGFLLPVIWSNVVAIVLSGKKLPFFIAFL
jgi:hypothetical protein